LAFQPQAAAALVAPNATMAAAANTLFIISTSQS
jgi:hypothetical protein